VLLGDQDPEPAEIGHLAIGLLRELAARVVLARVLASDLVLHEAMQRFVPVLLLIGELEIHSDSFAKTVPVGLYAI
jgi:hypothetical protein